MKCTRLAFLNGKPGEWYNVCTDISTDYNIIAGMPKQITGSKSKIVHVPNYLKSYQMFTWADMLKRVSELAFKPEYDYKKAIGKMFQKYKAENSLN